ncbi:hypothetical protein CANARDRAFT_5887 [[Candida] arabinofermentans NRRL YB-2248]|uniref:Nitrogen regulatory protein areA GATA-like domain-containing protein n=1 Tax=[Candida] arabinofermentans NRRL YB-2248 TaxID=983967 RepID=A0A1E4T6F9_9ASCO|nr:hypothetical protein CANARDRAFT_5887 [[Candida] arabinofermentans NRRL YB-2248]
MSNNIKGLNLAHQFLDDNFLDVTASDSFTKLPLISSNHKNNISDISPPTAVDYFSHKLTDEQYFRCWRSITNNKLMKPYELSNIYNLRSFEYSNRVEDLMLFLPCTSTSRLENACWRAWKKNRDNIPEIDPSQINWHKENDITVLYGPLIEERPSITATTDKPVVQLAKSATETEIEPMDEDLAFDGCPLVRTISSDSDSSTESSIFSDTTCKSILVTAQKRARSSSNKSKKGKKVSFSSEVDRRPIFDCTYPHHLIQNVRYY